MEPTLMIVGVNHRTAPVEVRERFSISDERRPGALAHLAHADAIDEVVVLATTERTEFILWTRDASAASGSILNFLTHEYGLTIGDWKHFYRKLDETALTHLFLVAAGLDSIAIRDRECSENLKEASVSALQAGTIGRFLDSVVQSALGISATLHAEGTRSGVEEAEKIAARAAKTTYNKLLAERVIPTIAALRRRLDEMCLQELESFYRGLEVLSSDQREMVEAFASRFTQRIAGTLAHELKEPCEKTEQERLTSAVQRLFHLEQLQRATTGAQH